MADTLLRELSNADLDWMITSGERKRLPSGYCLIDPETPHDSIYLLIEGELALAPSEVSPVQANDSSGQAELSAVEDTQRISQGEVVGISPLFDRPNPVKIKTLKESLVLSLTVPQIKQKMHEDIAFAAHFHRAIAVMLSDRLRQIFEQPGRLWLLGDRSAKEALSVFGELRDSDIDWLISFGHTEQIETNQVLLQAGRPADALYIILDGQLSLSAPEGEFNSLLLCFSGLEKSTRTQKAFASISRGGLPGIISFLDFRPLPVTIRADRNSLVFAMPRQMLVTKLQADNSFASRFYRVIAVQILELLAAVRGQEQDPTATLTPEDSNGEQDEELDLEDLDQMSEGAAKFNWMLNQLGVSHG